MHWNQQLQPYSTDHDTDYSMDHKPGESVDLRTDYSMDHKPDTQPDHNSCHSTEHKTVDHSDCAGSTQHPPCHPSQGSSDREQEEVGSGSPQQCRTSVCSRNRSPSCPPVPEHKALCHSETSSHRENRHSTPEHLLTAHVAVHGPGSTAPQTRGGDSECLTPSLLGVSDPEVESVATPVPDQHPRGHNLDGNKDGGDSVELLLGAPREGVGGGQREAPASPAKPGPSREKHALTSQPENEDFATSELEGEQKQQYICGGFAGMRTSLPSASPHQGQRSPSPSVPAVQWGCSTEQRTMPGKARRWRWTPEHKLQPEYEPEDRGMGAGRGKLFASLRSEESDIPPFADRMRFFEETSRSHSVSHLPGLVCPARRLKVPSLNQRRYSYQGCRDENPQNSHCPPQACRQTASCTVGRKPSDLEQNFSIRAHGQEEPDQGLPVDGDGSGSLCDSNDPCTFRPISIPGHQACPQQQPELNPRSDSPTEVQLGTKNEQTEPNWSFHQEERDQVLQPAEGAVREDCQRLGGGPRAPNRTSSYSMELEVEQGLEQWPSLSERDSATCVDLQQVQTCLAPLQVATQGDLADSSEEPKRKKNPPPRPPPPNWEQFNRRRSSCHNLLSPSPSAHLLSHPEVTRQRSHSLPMREGEETHLYPDPPRLTDSPASPEHCPRLRALRALPPAEGDGRDTLERQVEGERERRPACDAQLGLGAPLYRGQHSWAGAARENGSKSGVHSVESYFTMTYQPQGLQSQTLCRSATPTRSTVREEVDTPCETDIDRFLEGQRVQGLARPVAVLETDLDNLPEVRAPPPATQRAHGGSLVDLLLDSGSGASTRADLMGGLFPHSGEAEAGRETWRGGGNILALGTDVLQRHCRWGSSATQGPGSDFSSYYSTSSAEPQLLSQARALPGRAEEDGDDKLSYQKQKLVERVRRRLSVLREAQRGLQEDVRANTRLGEEVEALLLAVCRPSEVDRFRRVIGDLDNVVSLLLSLSSRLLRVEKALEGLSAEEHLRLPLLEKKKQLLGQLTEAQELKEHVDGRQRALCRVLGRCLTPEQLHDYSHFLRMKAALLVEQRQLEDRIRLCEEQHQALRESMGPGTSMPTGLGYHHY